MNAQRLIKTAQELYGTRGWQTKLAATLKVDTSTIRRWIYADSVPGPAAIAIDGLIYRRRQEASYKTHRQ